MTFVKNIAIITAIIVNCLELFKSAFKLNSLIEFIQKVAYKYIATAPKTDEGISINIFNNGVNNDNNINTIPVIICAVGLKYFVINNRLEFSPYEVLGIPLPAPLTIVATPFEITILANCLLPIKSLPTIALVFEVSPKTSPNVQKQVIPIMVIVGILNLGTLNTKFNSCDNTLKSNPFVIPTYIVPSNIDNGTANIFTLGFLVLLNSIKQAIVTTATTIFSPIKSVHIGNKFKAIKITLTFNIHLGIKFNILS